MMSDLVLDVADVHFPDHDAMRILGAGVPLTLLLDLVTLDGALSRDLVQVERADASWVHRAA